MSKPIIVISLTDWNKAEPNILKRIYDLLRQYIRYPNEKILFNFLQLKKLQLNLLQLFSASA